MANRAKSNPKEMGLYNELSIVLDLTEAHWGDGEQPPASEIEKRVIVKNGSQPIGECQVLLEELAYHFGGEWTDPPNGYEQKALKWAEGSDTQKGQIEIAPHDSAKLAILRMFRYPNPYFGITYADGSMGKTHHFTGAYRLRLRLEGNIGNKSSRQDVSPCIYEVYLRYVGALELEIEDIVKVRSR
jgi:hypothetical protein